MKTLVSLFFGLFFLTASYSQGINYQAVARTTGGETLANQNLQAEITIYDELQQAVYTELHPVQTNAFGLFSLVVGEGQPSTGQFAAIDWSKGGYQLGVRLDAGAGLVELGRSALQSVPYSFFATEAGKVRDLSVFELKDVQNDMPADGQVLKWNAGEQRWIFANDNVSDGSGAAVNTAPRLTGDGSANAPLDLARQGAQDGQVLQWRANAWQPSSLDMPSFQAGDGISLSNGLITNTGDTNAEDDLTHSSIAGGDAGGFFSNLQIIGLRGRSLADINPSHLQVLAWNGNQNHWQPATISFPSFQAGPGIDLNGNTIINTGDIDASDDLTQNSTAGGDASGFFSNLRITGLQGRTLADINPANGQVLAWNGNLNRWQPASINFPSFQAGTGISISGNTIVNTGDTNANDDITESTNAGGDVAGNFDNLLVRGLRGRPLANQAPVFGQVLAWNGSAWAPDSLAVANGSLWSSNGNKIFYNNGFVGIGTTNPLSKLHLFGGDLTIQDNFPVLTLNGSGANKIISFQINGAEQGSLIYSNGVGLRGNAGADLTTGSWVLAPNGNFGLGASSPQRKLHVHFDNNNGITSQMLISQAGGGDAWLNFGLDGGTHYAVGIDNSDGDKFKISYHPSEARGVGDNTRLTINNVGHIGIGVTDPRVDLDISGAFKLGTTTVTDAGIIRWTGADFEGRKGSEWVSLTGNALWNRNGNIAFYNQGRVGVGTSAPGSQLTISRPTQAAAYQLELRNEGNITNGNFDGIEFTQGTTGSTRLASIQVHYRNNGQPDMSLNLRNDNNVVFLEAGGNVGINTSNPAEKLDVNGNIRTNGEVRRTTTGSANLVPICYGNIDATGSIKTGTGNFSVSKTAAGRYDITINGESVFFEDYIVSINLAGDAGIATFSSISGKLRINTFNIVGIVLAADRDFSFVVYKP